MTGNGSQDTATSPGMRWFVAAAGAACVANATWWMQPVLMHDMIASRGLSEPSAGMVLSVEMGAMAFGSAIVAKFSVGRRLLPISMIGLLLTIVGSALSLRANSFDYLLFTRALAGAGTGAVLMMSNSVAALFPDPDKAFARMGVVNLLFGTVLLALLPFLRVTVPGATPFTAMLIAIVLLVPTVLTLPRTATMPRPHVADASEAGATATRNILLITGVTLFIGMASGTIWAFYALIGEQAGLSLEAVDSAISFAILTAIGGGALAAVLGGRIGRVLPCCAALTVISIAIIALSTGPTPLVFRIATCMNVAALYFMMPYLFGAAAAQDSSGRGAAYAGSAFFFTGAVSPALGGVLAATVGMQVMGGAVVVIAIIAAFIIYRVERKTGPHGVDLSRESPVQALHDAS